MKVFCLKFFVIFFKSFTSNVTNLGHYKEEEEVNVSEGALSLEQLFGGSKNIVILCSHYTPVLNIMQCKCTHKAQANIFHPLIRLFVYGKKS